MSNEAKDPSNKGTVNAEADQLAPEDLEKIAAGGVSMAKINVTNLSAGPLSSGGTGGVRGSGQILTRK